MDQWLRWRLEDRLSEKWAGQALDFISRGFSSEGERIIACIFFLAEDQELDLADVVYELEKAWETWRHQPIDLRGRTVYNGNAAGLSEPEIKICRQNNVLIQGIYGYSPEEKDERRLERNGSQGLGINLSVLRSEICEILFAPPASAL